jgi:hypothetical protein
MLAAEGVGSSTSSPYGSSLQSPRCLEVNRLPVQLHKKGKLIGLHRTSIE